MNMDISQQDSEETQEEYFENQATDIEVEDVGEQPAKKPWDPNKIRISTKPFSIRQIIDMMSDGEVDLAPDFQRLFVWNQKQRTRLIESILLGIPIPIFYFNQDKDGNMQVVDGVQRLTTIRRFAINQEPLNGLEYLQHLEGVTFADLEKADKVLKRRFQQTQIFANIIEPQTPDDVKFDVFRRINTGGSPLTGQEIRHCMSRGRSRDFLKKLTGMDVFHRATAGAFHHERRMADREVVLRFCAFRAPSSLSDYPKFESLDSFLLDFTRRVDQVHESKPALPDEELQRLAADFDRAMRSAAAVFDKYAFRKYPKWTTRRGPMNRALFESWAVALADYEPDMLVSHREHILNRARECLANREYFSAISQGTGDPKKVVLRFQTARDILKDALK